MTCSGICSAPAATKHFVANLLKNNLLTFILTVAAVIMCSCHKLDDDRIPPLPVYLSFNSVGMWDTYGVAGATSYRSFILNGNKRLPADFPFTALSQTGFGGILLVGDILGDPQAYDLACPVEVEQNVIVRIDRENNVAVCDKCGSTYDVFSNYGTPLSGPAAREGYGLQRYHVGRGTGVNYMLVTR